jgi:hypothetical protein
MVSRVGWGRLRVQYLIQAPPFLHNHNSLARSRRRVGNESRALLAITAAEGSIGSDCRGVGHGIKMEEVGTQRER